MDLPEILVVSSERAARVARACRQDPHLFRLLVEKKEEGEANPRFVEDFKTLADVLIQEMVKMDVVEMFPELNPWIKGEESNVFNNRLGESIKIEIKGQPNDTARLLETVLSGNEEAANRLAREVHKAISAKEVNTTRLPRFELDATSVGIWIDPIDSTSEYINAIETTSRYGVCLTGLRCATVLIGVYDRSTGVPLLGVINQPFSDLGSKGWSGECFWGVHIPNLTLTSLPCSAFVRTNHVTLSSSEDEQIKNKLKAAGFSLLQAAGAGYKTLMVARGVADAYILSKDTTFKWDTCAPHALLKALGGGIVEYKAALTGVIKELTYNVEDETVARKLERCCNVGGIIAYKNQVVLRAVLNALIY